MCREREHSTGANGEPYRNTPSTRGQRGRCVLPRITTEVCSVEARGGGPLSQTHTHTHTHTTLWTYLLPEVPPAPTAEECSRAEPVSTEGKGSELYPLPSGAPRCLEISVIPPITFLFPLRSFPAGPHTNMVFEERRVFICSSLCPRRHGMQTNSPLIKMFGF